MKHHRLITKKPQAAQVSNLQIIKNFLITLTDQIIEYIFQITS
jgi:hypothetical protein